MTMMTWYTHTELKLIDRTRKTGEKGVHPPTGSGHGPDLSQTILHKKRDQAYESVPSAINCVLPRV